MKSRHVFILISILIVCDAIAINAAFGTLFFSGVIKSRDFGGMANCLMLLNITWMVSALLIRTYSFRNVQTTELLFKKSAYTFISQVGLMFGIGYFTLNIIVIPQSVLYTLLLSFFAITFIRLATYVFERYYLKMNAYKKNIAIIGNQDLGSKLEKYFLNNRLSVNFTGSFGELTEETSIAEKPLSQLKRTIRFAIENDLDEVYTTQFPDQCAELNEVISLAEQNCVRVKFVTSFIRYKREEEIFKSANYRLSSYYDGIPILVNRREPLTALRNRIVKRTFDILFSLAVIIFILSWFLPLMMILIMLESKGNPIFAQLRSGRDNRAFYCYKFRSMRMNTLSNTKQAERNDPRITRIGAFMRKTSIDELPQFFNVLFGDMSIVGPRPHMLKHTEEYSKLIDQYMIRQFIKPGITGWAQVNGFRGETKEPGQMLNRVKHDIWYMENWSLLQDIKIIYKTVANAVKGEENAF